MPLRSAEDLNLNAGYGIPPVSDGGRSTPVWLTLQLLARKVQDSNLREVSLLPLSKRVQ